MHSTFTRLQNVFGFFTTVACVLAAFIAATDFSATRNPSGILKTNQLQVYAQPLLLPVVSLLSSVLFFC